MKTKPLAALLIALAVLSLAASFWAGPRIFANLLAAAHWLRRPGLGIPVFVAAEIAVTLVGIVPGALLGILAGSIFGLALGFCLSTAGILAGAAAAFALSRSILRPWIGHVLQRSGRLGRLDHMIADDGWRLVALLRISPVMPFSITSYVLGFSGISFRDYALGTCASLPPLLGYVGIGALGGIGAKTALQGAGMIHFALLGLGAAATLALTIHLSRLIGRVLRAA